MSIMGLTQSLSVPSMPAAPKIFQDLGRAELGNPRIVEQVEVVLTRAALRVVEEFLERDAVFVLQELNVEALRCGEGNDLFLEGHKRAIDEAADHDFLAGRLGRRR